MNVFIGNELVPDLNIEEAIIEETRVRAVRVLRDMVQNLSKDLADTEEETARQTPYLTFVKLQRVVDEMLESFTENDDVVFGLSTLRYAGSEVFEHSVNVCALSLALGCALHLDRRQLRELGVGAILHDLGKVMVSDLLAKDGPLMPDEWERMKQHPTTGYEILRQHFDISLFSAHVAFQHHERLDGSGYPRGLQGDQIHPYARICAIADYYDAVTHDRPYRARLEHEEVIETLADISGRHLDSDMVRKFMSIVARYPTGSIVRLNTGQIAVVIAQSKADPARPSLRVVSDRNYYLVEPYDLDLEVNPDCMIERVFEDYPLKLREHMRRRDRGL